MLNQFLKKKEKPKRKKCLEFTIFYSFYDDYLFVLSIIHFQVVIVPIWKKVDEKTGVLDAASSVAETLKNAGHKVKLDDTDQRTPGWKFNFWEMKVSLPLNG